MTGINRLKFINSLKQKKYRKQHQLFILEGEKLVDELLESRFEIHSVYASGEWISNHNSQHKPGYFPVYEIKESDLARVSSFKTPNKVLALARIPLFKLDYCNLKNKLTLVLDKVQDPGNLGTLIRSADWFGVDTVILSKDSAEITSPKVVQSTMGSIFRISFHYLDLPGLLKSPEIKDLPVFGAFINGSNIYSAVLQERGLVVLGNESRGISPGLEKLITKKISVPSFGHDAGSAESLNIAVAGSIILSEFRRRNNQAK